MEQIKLDIIPKGLMPVCHASQYDVGRVIRLVLMDGLQGYVISNETAILHVRKPDNTVVTTEVTISSGNNYVDIVTSQQMVAVAGENICELQLTKGDAVIGSLNFRMAVEADPMDGGDPSESSIHDLHAQVVAEVDNVIGEDYYTKEETNEVIDDALKDVYPLGEASGNIASFNTGVIMPLKSCECQINAYQAGTGDSSPSNKRAISGYTGIGISVTGKNLANQAAFVQGSISSGTGEATLSYTRLRSPFIAVKPNTTYCLNTNSSILIYEVYQYSKEGFIDYRAYSTTSAKFTTSSNANKIRFIVRKTDNSVINVSELTQLQVEEGNDFTAYEPFGKVVSIDFGGINKWDEKTTLGYFDGTGAWVENNAILSSLNPIPVEPNTTYFLHSGFNVNIYPTFWVDAQPSGSGADVTKFISRQSTSATNTTFTTPNNCHAIHFNIASGYGTEYRHDISINLPASVTDYHPYNPNGAGIVYGGKINITTGELIVTQVAKRLLTARTLSGTYQGSLIYNVSSEETSDADFTKPIMCNNLQYVGVSLSNFVYGTCINYSNTSFNLWVKNGAFANLAEATQWLNDNETWIMYYLATPIVYNLDPVVIKTLLNQNNIYHDCNGDIAVVYHKALTAKNIYFDNSGTTLTATNVEDAIKEVLSRI